MIKDTYPCFPSKDKTVFIFRSEGEKGSIVKMIIFTPDEEENEWNLAFGDLKDGDIDDSVISNNQDAMKIMRTVAKATVEFLGKHPNSIVVIEPVDEKRKRLYNYVFQKNFLAIDAVFDVTGIIGKKEEFYLPTKAYDIFKVSLK